MRRETKFKVLDPESGKLIGYERLKSGPDKYYCWQYSTNGVEWYAGVFSDFDYLRVQYIGLKDKNGVEIYEGDIVRFSQHYDDSDVIADITFIDCGFHAHYQKGQTIENWTGLPLNGEDQETMEIIGNVYENSGLLK